MAKSKRVKFSIRLLLILVTAIAIAFGYVINKQQSSPDKLMHLISRIGGRNYNISDHQVMPNLPVNPGIWARLTGTTRNVKNAVHFGVGSIDASTGKALDKISAADGVVKKVTFFQTKIDQSCPCFLWEGLTHVEFQDTEVIPDSWIDKLASMSSLKRLAFKGANTDISDNDVARFKHLDAIHLSNRGLVGARLKQLRESMPEVSIQVSGLWGKPWPFDAGKPLSKPDPIMTAKIRKLLDELKSELARVESSATNSFSPAATEARIAELEFLIGKPIPPQYRAFLEIHNGQPDRSHALFTKGKLMDIKDLCHWYKHRRISMLSDTWRDPSKMYFAGQEWNIDLDTGYLEMRAPNGAAVKFGDFIRLLTQSIRDGNFTQDANGFLQVTGP